MATVDNGGKGPHRSAEVNSEARLLVSAVTSTEADHNADKGNRWNINTGDITVTNATKLTLIYIKNTHATQPLFVTACVYNLGATTGGGGDVILTVVRNPASASDIAANANDCDIISNQNYGNTGSFAGVAYKGAVGETVAPATGERDGDSISTRSAANTGRIAIQLGAIVLTPGQSISLDYTPPVGNTSQVVQVALPCFFQDIVV